MSAVLKTVRRAMLLPVLSVCLWSLPGPATAYECKPELLKDHLQGLSRPDPRGVPGPTNIGSLKFVLRDYAYCGQYMADFQKVIDQATTYIEAHKNVTKPAIALDIDETSLSNWEEIEQDDFGFLTSGSCSLDQGVGCGDAAWELSARASAIKPTLELFKNARLAKIDIFFITGRHDRPDLREATERNLRDVGYVGYTDLVMQPKLSATVRGFKAAARKQIQDNGYTIIANIGDQFSDLDENPGETQFHVPNPFYFLP